MTNDERIDLARDLMGRALCHTDSPADAVTALVTAAVGTLEARFGATHAVKLMREMMEAAEQMLFERLGKQDGEAVQ